MKSRRSTHMSVGCVILGLAAGATACRGTSTPARPTPLIAGDVSSRTSDVTPSARGNTGLAVSAELAGVRRATARFHDISAAIAAGYTTQFEPCVWTAEGAMGIHARNEALMTDQVLDPERPELLLYEPQPNGGHRLVGVEYFIPVLVRNRTTHQEFPWVSPDRWLEADYERVTPEPQLFGHSFDGPMPGHIPTMPWHWDLHAWIWSPNPNGMFAQWNPAVHCE